MPMGSVTGTNFETKAPYPSLSIAKETEVLHLVQDFSLTNGAQSPHSEPLGFMENFMTYIPARMGRSTALDDAVTCLSTAQIAYLLGDAKLECKGLSQYAQALGSLQKALYDRVEGKSEETLCATLLLAQFEVSLNVIILVNEDADRQFTVNSVAPLRQNSKELLD